MLTRPDHLTIANCDRAAADEHYGKLLPLLGFSETAPGIWHDGDSFWLQMITAHDGTGPYERYGPGINHVGFNAESREAVESLRDKLIEAGIDAQPLQDLGGATALFVADPDGLRIEITYYPDGMPPVG